MLRVASDMGMVLKEKEEAGEVGGDPGRIVPCRREIRTTIRNHGSETAGG